MTSHRNPLVSTHWTFDSLYRPFCHGHQALPIASRCGTATRSKTTIQLSHS